MFTSRARLKRACDALDESPCLTSRYSSRSFRVKIARGRRHRFLQAYTCRKRENLLIAFSNEHCNISCTQFPVYIFPTFPTSLGKTRLEHANFHQLREKLVIFVKRSRIKCREIFPRSTLTRATTTTEIAPASGIRIAFRSRYHVYTGRASVAGME